MAERIMFQFALHSHATENATVVYLTGFRAEALVGQCSGTVDRSTGRPIGRSISTISAPTGREGSDAVTENLKNRKRGEKKTEKKWEERTRGGRERVGGRGKGEMRARGEIAASTTDKKRGELCFRRKILRRDKRHR